MKNERLRLKFELGTEVAYIIKCQLYIKYKKYIINYLRRDRNGKENNYHSSSYRRMAEERE